MTELKKSIDELLYKHQKNDINDTDGLIKEN